MPKDRAQIRRLLYLAGMIAAMTMPQGIASAQTTVFSGRVTSAGRPLGGASVGIPSLGVGAITSVDGRYNFTLDVSRAGGRAVDVVARYIGYKPKRLPVVLTAGRVD